MNGFYGRFVDVVLRGRLLVVGTWLVVLIAAGTLLAPRAATVVQSLAWTAPGSDSQKAADLLQHEFAFSSLNTTAVVLHSSSLTTDQPEFQVQLAVANQRIRKLDRVRQVRDLTSGDASLVSADHHTTVIQVVLAGDDTQQQDVIPRLRQRLAGLSVEYHVAGRAATNYDFRATSEDDLRHAEVITFPLILVLLLVAFRSVVAAAIPLLLGAASVVIALSFVYLIGSHQDLSIFVINVSTMFGLGLGIDFSLIVVNRFRTELAAGREVRDAVLATMASAGRSVTYSGVTVLLGMLLMTLLLDLTVVRSISLGVSLVALAAVASALTLLPALLMLLGRRVEWLALFPRRVARTSLESGFWYRASRAITRRPWPWLIFSVVLLLALAFPVHDLQLTGSDPELLPRTSDSVLGLRTLNDAFGPNQLTPIQVVIRSRDKAGVLTPPFLDSLARLTNDLGTDSRVERVTSLATVASAFNLRPTDLSQQAVSRDPRLQAVVARLLNATGDVTVINIVPRFGPYTSEHESLVNDLRHRVLPNLAAVSSEAHVGGGGPAFLDFRDRLYSEFPILAVAVLGLTFLMLMMFFQSILLPLKAVVLSVFSILATYGVLVAVFEYGWGSRLAGFEPLGKITTVTPAVLFVILFGLSTDYEVFVLSRVRESYRATRDNARAVALGLQQTAGIITTAAVILIGIFLSFATAGILTIKELGIGLGVGILIDTTVVRVIMVPATMRLLGAANWWMPGWLRRFVPELSEARAGPILAATPIPAAKPVAAATPIPAARPITAAEPIPAVTAPAAVTSSGPASAAAGMAVLEVVVDSQKTAVQLLRESPVRIGQAPDNQVRVSGQSVSSHHAQVSFKDGSYVVTDLNSRDGLFVNGSRMEPGPKSRVLHDGDEIQLGAGGPRLVFKEPHA